MKRGLFEQAKLKADVYLTATENIRKNKELLELQGSCKDPKCNLPLFFDDYNDKELATAINAFARIAHFPNSGKLVRELLFHMLDEQRQRKARLPWWKRLLRR